MELEAFAAKRGTRLDSFDTDLRPVVETALANYGPGWAADLAEAAGVLYLEMFEESVTGSKATGLVKRFQKRLADALDRTAAPDSPPDPAQVKRVATWISTYTANSAASDAAVAGRFPARQWVTRQDAEVRPAHTALHGEIKPFGKKFDVGTAELSFPGEPVGDPAGWIECRCLLRPAGEARTVVASGEPSTGVVVVALPAASDPISAASSEEDGAHMTLVYLGDVGPDTDVEGLKAAVEEWAAKITEPITEGVSGTAVLGADAADVVLVDAAAFVDIRSGMVEDAAGAIGALYAQVEQFPQWLSHVTLGYPESPPAAEYAGTEITFDRLALWAGEDRTEFPLGGSMPDTAPEVDAEPIVAAVEAPVEEAPVVDEPAVDEPDIDEPIRVPWHGVLAPTGVPSGDGRMFARDGLTNRVLPLPLRFISEDFGGHAGAVTVATIETIEYDDQGLAQATGFFRNTPEADAVIAGIVDKSIRGVSVDVDDMVIQMPTDEEMLLMDQEFAEGRTPVTTISSARIAAATIVAIPAFQEAYIALGEKPVAAEDMPAPVEVSDEELATLQASAAEFAPGTKDGPGWVTEPKATSRLRKYWTKEEGALKIAWGVPGDFDRCRAQLGKYVEPQYLAGTCANLHKEALGVWPGQENGGGHALDAAEGPSLTLVAAGGAALPSSAFADPKLNGPTPLTITEDGRIFGHLATWGTCHIGMQGVCTTAPQSKTGYAYFTTGAVQTDAGPVAVGQITMGIGHAPLRASAQAAAAHYDNTRNAVADVAAGEDGSGIWVAGLLRPGVTDEQRHALAAGALSGDWRSIQGNLEMVAALAVNVPGFPIPRTSLAASGQTQTALVAAGVQQQNPELDASMAVVAAATENVLAELARRERIKNARASTAGARALRIERARRI
jgi:hypothetical protein